MTPKRIQRRRTKGWRMPDGAIYVGRPSIWGNPYHVPGRAAGRQDGIVWPTGHGVAVQTREDAVAAFRAFITDIASIPEGYAEYVAPLRGQDLACWCPLCDVHADGRPFDVACPDCSPCHADVLLELANA